MFVRHCISRVHSQPSISARMIGLPLQSPRWSDSSKTRTMASVCTRPSNAFTRSLRAKRATLRIRNTTSAPFRSSSLRGFVCNGMPDVPASSELRTEEDNTLVSRSKLYNEAFATKDLNRLNALFDAKVVYHADEVTLRNDISGKKEVLEYIQAYLDRWDFERVETFGATNDSEHLAFSVSVDKGVTPKPGVHDEQRDKDQVKPSNVINITALFFDKDSGLLTHIYPARQLSYDEAHRKMNFVPDYKGSSFNPEWLEKSEVKPSGDRIDFHKEYAEDWNQMFCKNDLSRAEKIADPNIKVHNLLLSSQTDGLDAFKKDLSEIFNDWECTSNTSHIGVTAGNKAFVLWETQGLYKNDKSSVWGITVLLFNEKQIKEAASIFQPFPKMRKSISKGG